MNLQDANRELCQRMLGYVQQRPLTDRELRVGCDFSDAYRHDGGSQDPQWFAANRDSIAKNLKGNVQTIITLMQHNASMQGVPIVDVMQNHLKTQQAVHKSEQWSRGLVRRRLCRQALRAALTSPMP
jgi:hypothetical protein